MNFLKVFGLGRIEAEETREPRERPAIIGAPPEKLPNSLDKVRVATEETAEGGEKGREAMTPANVLYETRLEIALLDLQGRREGNMWEGGQGLVMEALLAKARKISPKYIRESIKRSVQMAERHVKEVRENGGKVTPEVEERIRIGKYILAEFELVWENADKLGYIPDLQKLMDGGYLQRGQQLPN